MNNNTVKYPSMRGEMIYYLELLQDELFQRRVWKELDFSSRALPFDHIVHFFYDDTALSRDPTGCIGTFLLNEQEAHAIRAVTASIDLMVERHGWKDHDADYLTLPEWSAVIEAARDAHVLFGPGTEEL